MVDDEGILFDEVAQKLFHLNTLATFIWCHIEENQRVESIIDATARSMRIERVTARRHVLQMIRSWRRLGLLRGGRPREAYERQARAKHGRGPQTVRSAGSGLETEGERRNYRLLDTSFSLGFSHAPLEMTVHPVLAHLDQSEPDSSALQLNVVMEGGRLQVWYQDQLLGSCTTILSLAPIVQGIMSVLALRRFPFLLALHAAGIALRQKAMLLVGASGSAKTTLAAALLANGWDYLSDDMILLEPQALRAVAMPYSLGFKRGGWELVASHFPDHRPPVVHLRPDGKAVRYLSPPRPRRGFAHPRSIRWVVFPRLSPTSRGSIRPLRRLEGVQRLMQHCCGIPNPLTPEDVGRLLRWSADVRWFDMELDDLPIALARLTQATAELRGDTN